MTRAMVAEDIYYPGDPTLLRKQLQTAFRTNETVSLDASVVVAPYGAYELSLDYLVTALKATGVQRPDLVFLLAPHHTEGSRGVLLPESDSFATPFGELPVATPILDHLQHTCRTFSIDEIAHLQDHSIEVLLPAVHYHFGTVPIVPLLVTPLQIEMIQPVADSLIASIGEKNVKVVVGANLSGFTDPSEADAIARKVIRLIMTAPGDRIVESLTTFEDPPRSTWPLVLGHILAGRYTRPQILRRGTFDTEYDGDVGTVAFSSIAYQNV